MLVQAKQLPDAKAALCGCHDPWHFGETPSLSFALQVQRLFQASSGPLGGIVALLESTFESQGDIPWKNQRLSDPDQTEEASRRSVSLIFREINIWNFSYTCLNYRLFVEGQLGGCLTIG